MMLDLNHTTPRRSIIKIIGIGGAGCNAVNRMFDDQTTSVDFAVCHTDKQKLDVLQVKEKLCLGATSLKGRGTGNDIEKAKLAVQESRYELEEMLDEDVKMVFLVAGLGRSTGSVASVEIAKLASSRGILCVSVVCYPSPDMDTKTTVKQAESSINELSSESHALIVMDNHVLFNEYAELPEMKETYAKGDEIISDAVLGISEIITLSGHVNIDFADVRTVLAKGGVTIMGRAAATGKNRAKEAVLKALSSPLLKNKDIEGANDILVNIVSSKEHETRILEVKTIGEHLIQQVGQDVNLIYGIAYKESLSDELLVTVVATGFRDTITENHLPSKKIDSLLLTAHHNILNDYLLNPSDRHIIENLEEETALQRKKRLQKEDE